MGAKPLKETLKKHTQLKGHKSTDTTELYIEAKPLKAKLKRSEINFCQLTIIAVKICAHQLLLRWRASSNRFSWIAPPVEYDAAKPKALR